VGVPDWVGKGGYRREAGDRQAEEALDTVDKQSAGS
jgi:hypothetical protein